MRSIPEHIRHSKDISKRFAEDIAMRDANTSDEFSMTLGNRTFSGKGAREEAARALSEVVLSWRNDESVQVRGHFRGFDILTRGHSLKSHADPDILVRGAQTYRAQFNPENPQGTMQSIEHALRSLDRRAEDALGQAADMAVTFASLTIERLRFSGTSAEWKDTAIRFNVCCGIS